MDSRLYRMAPINICGSSIQSSWTGPNESASIELGARPGSELSEVAPNASSAIYSVASFHTHTTIKFIINF